MSLKAKIQRARGLLLENRSFKQTILKNTIWLAISNVGGRTIRAVLIIYAARALGAEGYGIFSYALGLAAFFSIFSDIGVSGILTREISRRPEVIRQYTATALFIKIGLLAINVLMIVGLAPFFTKIPAALTLLHMTAILLAFDGMRDFTLSLSRAREKMEVEGAINIITNLAIVAAGFTVLFMHPTPKALLTGYTLGSGIGMLVALWVLRDNFREPFRNFQKSLLIPIFTEAAPFAMVGILGALMLNTDTIMIGWLQDATAVGLYSAAQRPVQIFYMLPTFLATALFPAFARMALDQTERFSAILERVIAGAFLLSIPLVLGGVILSKEIILLLFGSEFAGASTAFAALMITVLLNFPSSFIANAIFSLGRQKVFIWSSALGAVGNVALNYVLIPRFGILGSCIATIGAQVLSQGFLWYTLKGVRPFRVLPHIGRILAASAVMGTVVFFMQRTGANVFASIILGAGIYGALLFLLKEPLLTYLRPSTFRDAASR